MEDIKEEKQGRMSKFSVELGLFDYINPICYLVTSITLLLNLTKSPWFLMYLVGAIISLIFGFTIPTLKLLIGLGKLEFKMPVNIVFYVNSGIFVSGLALFKIVKNISNIMFLGIILIVLLLLFLIYKKTNKFNAIAVLIGAAGYLLIYISLISLAISANYIASAILYGIAIVLFVFLILVGIKANLKDARVHWVIEICNVCCQLSVAISTVLLFKQIV